MMQHGAPQRSAGPTSLLAAGLPSQVAGCYGVKVNTIQTTGLTLSHAPFYLGALQQSQNRLLALPLILICGFTVCLNRQGRGRKKTACNGDHPSTRPRLKRFRIDALGKESPTFYTSNAPASSFFELVADQHCRATNR